MSEILNDYKSAAEKNQFKSFLDKYLTENQGIFIEFGHYFGAPQLLLMWISKCGCVCKYSSKDNLFDENTCTNYRLARVMGGKKVSTCGIRSTVREVLDNPDNVKIRLIPSEDIYEILGECYEEDYLDNDFLVTQRTDEELSFSAVEKLREFPIASNPNEGTKMTTTTTTTMTASSKFASIVERSKTAGVNAVQYQAGKAMNAAVMTAVKPRLPMMVRGYADHPAAPIIAAIAMAFAAEFLPEGDAKGKVVKATDLMLGASFMEGADKFLNVEKLVSDVFAKLPPEARVAIENPNL